MSEMELTLAEELKKVKEQLSITIIQRDKNKAFAMKCYDITGPEKREHNELKEKFIKLKQDYDDI